MKLQATARVALLSLFATTADAQHLVDLSFAPASQSVPVGTIIDVDLVGSSNGPVTQAFGGVDALLDWDPTVLALVGNDDSMAAAAWFVSGFLTDPDGINADQTDGDALYTALSPITTPALAAPTGSTITTLRFQTLAPTASTTIRLTPMLGSFGKSRVLAFSPPGSEITGSVAGLATVEITPSAPAVAYCTAKLNSLGCSPAIGWSGVPGATEPGPFLIQATQVLNLRNGLLFYGYSGRAALPFLGGTLCVMPPNRRTGLQNAGGSLPPTMDCSGSYSFDFNALIQSGIDPLLVPGQQINGQYWSRDSAQPDGTGVSLANAIEFVIGS